MLRAMLTGATILTVVVAGAASNATQQSQKEARQQAEKVERQKERKDDRRKQAIEEAKREAEAARDAEEATRKAEARRAAEETRRIAEAARAAAEAARRGAELVEERKLPEPARSMVRNRAHHFVEDVMGRLTFEGAPIGRLATTNVRTTIRKVGVEADGTSYANIRVQWEITVPGPNNNLECSAALLVCVLGDKRTWMVVPISIDDTVRHVFDAFSFTTNAMYALNDQPANWGGTKSLLEILTGAYPNLPTVVESQPTNTEPNSSHTPLR